MAGTSPAMTREKWFDITEIRSKQVCFGQVGARRFGVTKFAACGGAGSTQTVTLPDLLLRVASAVASRSFSTKRRSGECS